MYRISFSSKGDTTWMPWGKCKSHDRRDAALREMKKTALSDEFFFSENLFFSNICKIRPIYQQLFL